MNRRNLLTGIGGATLTGLAGCIGTISGSSKGGSNEATTSSQGSTAETGLGVGKKPPDFTLRTTSGSDVSLHPVEKPTVMFFMAAWCTSCKHEESNLEQVFDRHGNDVRIISVDMDPDRDSMDDLRQFEQQYGGDWIHAMGTKELIRKYRLTSLDVTYILDENGVTRYKDSDVTAVKTFERELAELH